MKVISYELGRVSLYVWIGEIRPPQGVAWSDLIEATTHRYGFGSAPILSDLLAEMAENGAKFGLGRIHSDSNIIAINEFRIFNGGLQVDAQTTEGAEIFLDDFLDWTIETFGFRKPEKPARRMMWSQVIAEFERPIGKLFAPHESATRAINQAIKETKNYAGEVDFAGVAFSIDQTAHPSGNLSPEFTINRWRNAPYSDEQYYCVAPLHTRRHVQVLETIEGLV